MLQVTAMSQNTLQQSRWKGFRNMASLARSTLSGVEAVRGHPRGSLSCTDPCRCHFDIHSVRVLRLGASRLGN